MSVPYVTIPLNGVVAIRHNFVALVSPEDEELVRQYDWRAEHSRNGVYYAVRGRPRIYMHRLIMQPPKGLQVDHINHNGLDNRRENLRVCTLSQNVRNCMKTKKNKTGFKGVYPQGSYRKINRSKPYQAMIRVNCKLLNLGYYATPEEAARAYDVAARSHFGEFARLNFPD